MNWRLVATSSPTKWDDARETIHENYYIGRVLSEVSYAVEPRVMVITMNNQYIICGASRSGKSILARRMQENSKSVGF
jgi:hypothetical protein